MRLPLARTPARARSVVHDPQARERPGLGRRRDLREIGRLEQRGQTKSVLQHTALDLVFRDEVRPQRSHSTCFDRWRCCRLRQVCARGCRAVDHHLMNTALHVACVALVFSIRC
jgi:hypothetical protein